MHSSLYIGATGMKSISEGLQVAANNLANCSTIGFKSQSTLFSDLISQEQCNPGEWDYNQQDSLIAVGQYGMGVRVDDIATNFKPGNLESTNSMTDLAISGKGFFVVQDLTGNTYYTRAGDFIVDENNIMRNPSGLALLGYDLQNKSQTLQPINLDKTKEVALKNTSQIKVTETNIVPSNNFCTSSTDPYFTLLQSYDATQSSPLNNNQYSDQQSVTIYDEIGKAQEVTIYYDGAQCPSPEQAVEFLVAKKVDGATQNGEGLLMSGILQFDSAGNLIGIAAYTPTVMGSTNLNDWQSASLSGDGLPQFSLNGNNIALNFGISSTSSSTTTTNTAADVGTNFRALSNLANTETTNYAVTGYNGGLFQKNITQDGYDDGLLTSYNIGTNGVVHGTFSNGEILDLWQIPLARFTREDGLLRSGSNLFTATSEVGNIDLGVPGSENYGTISSYYIEQSNVDVATEMVSLIVTQRGFQSNAKVVTTSDEMLRTAINLKQR
ncbi:MAG: flagellar hook-basal body complex protein [Desulfovibrio sp.]|nr:flagellar hook-basal body complex protein [Desulfovibrio sp.]